MSLLNIALQHISLYRDLMEPWAESAVANCSSMADIRKVYQRQQAAQKALRQRGVRSLVHMGNSKLGGSGTTKTDNDGVEEP